MSKKILIVCSSDADVEIESKVNPNCDLITPYKFLKNKILVKRAEYDEIILSEALKATGTKEEQELFINTMKSEYVKKGRDYIA